MYRPGNWDIMDYCSVEEQMESPLLAMHFFEAGADAMLREMLGLIEKIAPKRIADDVKIYMGIPDEEG